MHLEENWRGYSDVNTAQFYKRVKIWISTKCTYKNISIVQITIFLAIFHDNFETYTYN